MTNSLFKKLRPSDLVLTIYIAAITRQFFWGVEKGWLAWSLTALVSTGATLLHASLREPIEDSQGASAQPRWTSSLIAVLPLALFYLLRFSIPDHNFDVLNYHLQHLERGLRGWPFIPGDFFPTAVQINPSPDMALGIVKHLLGYRLGTALNLAAMAWTASLSLRALREIIPSLRIRIVAAIYVVSTEIILYLLSTYQVDLLALPLLLEATLVTVNYERLQRKTYAMAHVGLFLGIALAFKLTNLAYIIPIGAVLLYQAYRSTDRAASLKGLLPSALTLIAPATPFLLYMWAQTGNPTFPYYNRFFNSPYWDTLNIEDPTHGPKKLVELILWPFWVYVFPERGSEFVGGESVYTARITLGFIFGTVALFTRGLKPEVRKLGIIAAASTFLWSASSGNLRYGLFLEIIGGVVILNVLADIINRRLNDVDVKDRWRRTALISAFVVLFCMQVMTSYRQAATLNQILFGDKVQVTVFQKPRLYLAQLPHLFRDRDAINFLTDRQRAETSSAEVWINSYPTTASMMTSLRPEIPMISVSPFLDDVDIYDPLKTEAARAKCAEALSMARGKKLYTLSPIDKLKTALFFMQRSGLRAVEITDFPMPFYSTDLTIDLKLIRVEPVEGATIQPLRRVR